MVQPWRTMFNFLRPCSANSVTRTAKTMSDMLDCSSYELRHRLKDSDTHNQKLLHISAMAKCFSLWMVAKKSTIQQCIAEGKLCCHTGKESDYSYIGASSDRTSKFLGLPRRTSVKEWTAWSKIFSHSECSQLPGATHTW